MERPESEGEKFSTWVEAHNKSAGPTTELSLWLYLGLAFCPCLLLLSPAPTPTIWAMVQMTSRYWRRSSEGRPEARNRPLAAPWPPPSWTSYPRPFSSPPRCPLQLSWVMASSKFREPVDEVFGKCCLVLSLAKATWHGEVGGRGLGSLGDFSVCVCVCGGLTSWLFVSTIWMDMPVTTAIFIRIFIY